MTPICHHTITFQGVHVETKAFPKFEEFFSLKRQVVQLLHNVNATLKVPIIPSQISLFLNGLKGKNNIEAVKTCTHTLVTHRVGYHYDVFSKGSDGIENKVLVEAEGKGGNKDGSCPSLGRGGGGSGVFTYCILDW